MLKRQNVKRTSFPHLVTMRIETQKQTNRAKQAGSTKYSAHEKVPGITLLLD